MKIRFFLIFLIGAMLFFGCASQPSKNASVKTEGNDSQKNATEGTPGQKNENNLTGKTRLYYIAADEVEWDYAPSGKNLFTGEPFGDAENVFVEQGINRIGKVYTKCLYREYTDATFETIKPRTPEWVHLGSLGPVIRAEVGDTIKILFKNNCQIPASLHPHGVFYEKDSEGAPYNDGTSSDDKDDDSVEQNKTHTYTWKVPERAGPGPGDPSSMLWMYHSHVDESGDTNAGLVGPIIITRKGMALADGSPKDVDREFVVMFTVFDENRAPYIDHNIDTKIMEEGNLDIGDSGETDAEGESSTETYIEELEADEDFHESNLMHSINGFVFGNLPGLAMKKGEHVRWYVFGMGTEVDLHTPHWHGNTLLEDGKRVDVVDILPASMTTADMIPDAEGTWLFHCHVNDHIDAGMVATYNVTPG